jgi:CRISPR/Cas system-associated exonuclease Cas4 (RecB family)
MHLKYGPYSPSRLDTALCPYSFKRQYIDKNVPKGISSLPQERGSVVHEVFESITKKYRDNKGALFTEDELYNLIVESVKKHPTAAQDIASIRDMVRLYVKKLPSTMTSDAEVELKIAIKWDSVKKDFIECDYDDPQAFARGRADIMMISDDTTYALVYDHKTQPNIEEADTFQMGFYAWVIAKTYPFLKEVRTVLHLARYGFYSEPHVWTKEELKNVEDIVKLRVSIIEGTDIFDAIPNSKCQYCPVIADCPAYHDAIEVSEDGTVRSKVNSFKIFDTEKAIKTAQQINVLEEVLKQSKLNLKEYVKATGPVAIAGKVFQFKAEEKIHWDTVNKTLRENLYKLFEKHHIDVKRYMSFNQTATNAVWNLESGNQVFIKELSDAVPRKIASEFGSFKL